MTDLRVLVWSPTGFGDHYSGPANSMKRLFETMKARHSFHLTVVHGSDLQGAIPSFVDEVIALGRVHGDSRVPGERLFHALIFLCRSFLWLKSNRDRIDVVILATSSIYNLAPGIWAKVLGLPVVGRIAAAETELYDQTKLKHFLSWSRLRVRMLSRFDRTIALSQQIHDRLLFLGMHESSVFRLPNGADVGRFAPVDTTTKLLLRRKYGIADNCFCVASVGKVGKRKGQLILLEAMSSAQEEAHLLLAGPFESKEDEALFAATVDRIGMKGRVYCLGHIAAVEEAFQVSDMFALISNSEGMPNAMVEAMSCALPAIGTNVSGIPDLIGVNERGIIVNRDAKEIASAIGEFCSNKEWCSQVGSIAREFILKTQSSAIVSDSMFEVLHGLRRDSTSLNNR